METLIIAIVLFAITYILLFALPKYKPYIALGSAIIFSLWLTLNKEVDFTFATFIGAIDFNVLMMIAGTMGIVSFFIESKMPMRIADVMLSKFKNVKMAIVAMAVFAGVVSAFMDNVATVLIVAPIAFAMCKYTIQIIKHNLPVLCKRFVADLLDYFLNFLALDCHITIASRANNTDITSDSHNTEYK